jgi:hypothetical protein
MVCFQTQNPNLGKFWKVLQWEILACLMTIWSILLPFGLFCGNFVYFSPLWYFVPRKIWQPCARRLRLHMKRIILLALAAWSSGIVFACGVKGREFEFRQGIE